MYRLTTIALSIASLLTPNLGYFVSTETFYTYDEASTYCTDRGSILATWSNEAEFTAASNACKNEPGAGTAGKGCWTGLKQASSASKHYFPDGTLCDYACTDGSPSGATPPWVPGEPNNAGELCVNIVNWSSYRLNDCTCGSTWNRALCGRGAECDLAGQSLGLAHSCACVGGGIIGGNPCDSDTFCKSYDFVYGLVGGEIANPNCPSGDNCCCSCEGACPNYESPL